MFRKWVLMLAVCSFTCIGNAREFPLCVYGVSEPEQVKIVKDAGFTCFQSYQKKPEIVAALAKEANKYHLKTVFYPNDIIGSEQEKNAQSWPMLAWYLVDEPDVHKWTRRKVEKANQKAKKAFQTLRPL